MCDCGQVLAMMNKATLNIWVQVSVSIKKKSRAIAGL